MKIIHAVADEHGKAHGGALGDQTGKEIREAEWYNKPWDCYLAPKDKVLGVLASNWAEQIAEGNFGYNQDDRWSGYKSILENGIDKATGDFDCSSLVISCYIFAGAKLKPTGYTGNLERILVESGLFTAYHDEHLLNPHLACQGGLYVRKNSHVCMCVECGSDFNFFPEETEGKRIKTKGSVRIRTKPVDGEKVRTATNEVLTYVGTDPETGWLILSDGNYITNNKRYIEYL